MIRVRNKRIIIAGVFGIFVAVLFFLARPLERHVASFLFSKLYVLESSLGLPVSYRFYPIFNKPKDILEENTNLKKENEKLKAKIANLEFSVSRPQGVLTGGRRAGILFRPPATPYDQVIIDKGKKDGLKVGRRVLAYEDILLGQVDEVFESTSRVVLFSSYGQEQDVFLERAQISVSASGQGNSEFLVTLPRDFPVRIGERVFSGSEPAYLIGLVEAVTGEATSPIKKIRIRQPFNLNHLHTVYVLE